MRDAISYKRFSLPKQMRGDSDRRQTQLTENYCIRHKLRLIDSYLDAGLSGFTGANLNDGSALKLLLQAAKLGHFKPGTRLIIESLDRLTRREISTAVRLFLDILDMGLVIVTLIDGEEVFTKARVDNDLTALIIAIVFLSRANNESRTKQQRALEDHKIKRKKAREHKILITAECPKWLTVVGKADKRHFVVNRSRVCVIERVFKMAASGYGQWDIVRYLNQHHVPTFSGVPKWRPGILAHLLASRAVLGEFQPHLSVRDDGKTRRIADPEGPIENYFPAVISKELYDQARFSMRSRTIGSPRKRVPAYSNLVSRLGHCALCGAALHLFQGGGDWAYLRCADALQRECSNRQGYPYRKLEAVLFALDELTEIVARLASTQSMGAAVREDHTLVKSQRVERAERKAFLARFKAARSSADSSDLDERDLSRRVLVSDFRRLIDGVVMHAERTLTVHFKSDSAGMRIVYILDRDGILGIQLKALDGTTGFIDRSLLWNLVRPVKSGAKTPIDPDDERLWQSRDIGQLLRRARIVTSSDGDWQAVASHPLQMARVVVRAEQALRAC